MTDTPRLITRRNVLTGIATASLISASTSPVFANAARVLTPRQTTGPFYPDHWRGDADADLVRVTGEAARAQGRVLYLLGTVTNAKGTPIPNAEVEIWQADANGVYRHPRERGYPAQYDNNFQGRGRTTSNDQGEYRFRTIIPGQYPGRTPHIHMRVATQGRASLSTQIYFADAPGNASDFLLQAIRNPAERNSLIMTLQPADRIEPNAQAGTFNVVLA